MNGPRLSLPLSAPIPDVVKKKRVLLIDASHVKRDLRAGVMRKVGIDVDSAADIVEARVWWRPALYDLVLINMEKGVGQRDKFCDDIRTATPPQRLAFLVGGPEYPLPIRAIRLSAGASWKPHDESPRPAFRPLLAPKPCAACHLRLEILKRGQRDEVRHRLA